MAAPRILVVEDESIVARDIQNRLQKLGYLVPAVAYTGRQALELAEDVDPDLVLMDIRLRGDIDGIDTARQIRSQHDIPIIYLTAYSDSDTLQRAKQTEPYGYILKPFEEQELRTTIEMALYKHQMESRLRANEQWLHTTLRSIGHGVIATGNSENIIFMNSVAERLTGWPLAEVFNRNLYEVFLLADDTQQKPTPLIETPQLVTRYGRYVPIQYRKAPIEDERNLVQGAVLVFSDISHRQEVEQALQESEARFRAIFESTAVGIIQLNLTGHLMRSNPALQRMLGYSEESLHLKAFVSLVYPEDVTAHQQQFDQLMKGEQDHLQAEQRFVRQDGSLIWGQVTISLVRDANNEPWFVIGMIEDITDRRQLWEQLLQLQKMEAVGRLAGGIAHDFNNLLTVIMSYSDLLLRRIGEDDPLRRSIQEIQKAGERAAALTRQLLTSSRKHDFQPQVVNLNDIILAMEKILSRVVSNDITIVTRLDPNLRNIHSDPRRIEQMIMNLALNAQDAMPEQGTLTIETANTIVAGDTSPRNLNLVPGQYVLLTVSDTGIGLEDDIKAHIFEPFFTTKKHGAGAGLGLSIVYGIVQQSNGTIVPESQPGRGTTFKIYLPQTDEAPIQDENNPFKQGAFRGTETILVVEDKNQVQELARSILHRQGYKILKAATGQEALATSRCYEETIHLLVTDVVLPGLKGYDLATEIATLHPEVKILFMSGPADLDDSPEIVSTPNSVLLRKPFLSDDLLQTVRQLLDQ